MRTNTLKRTKEVLTILLLSVAFTGISQVNPGQIDDFEDGTTENWIDGGSSVPPVNIPTGGPLGANDNYLQDEALGGGGPGSKMVMFNDQQWTGNYISQGIIRIIFNARAVNNDLNLRIAFDGGGGRICTVNAVLIPAGGSWQQYSIPIMPSDFTTVAGGTDVSATLSDVTDMRILSNTSPSWQGESIVATLEIDNIEASTTLGTAEFTAAKLFEMIPNISKSSLNIRISDALMNQNMDMKIYDITGKLILEENLGDARSVDLPISSWDNGIYLIKLSTGVSQQVERFIKL